MRSFWRSFWRLLNWVFSKANDCFPACLLLNSYFPTEGAKNKSNPPQYRTVLVFLPSSQDVHFLLFIYFFYMFLLDIKKDSFCPYLSYSSMLCFIFGVRIVDDNWTFVCVCLGLNSHAKCALMQVCLALCRTVHTVLVLFVCAMSPPKHTLWWICFWQSGVGGLSFLKAISFLFFSK